MYYVITKVMFRCNTRYQLNFINNYSRCNYILYDKSENCWNVQSYMKLRNYPEGPSKDLEIIKNELNLIRYDLFSNE